MKKKIIGIIIYLVVLFLSYYLTLPIINLHNAGFYFYFAIFILAPVLVIAVYLLKNVIVKKLNKKGIYTVKKRKLSFIKVHNKYTLDNKIEMVQVEEKFTFASIASVSYIVSVGLVVILMIFYGLIGCKLFRAKSYHSQLSINEGTIEEFNETFDSESNNVLLPVIDKDLAFKLAQARLGDYGSQFDIDVDNFTLISINRNGKSELVRIAPIDYSNVFVAMSRKSVGSIGYIEVNVVTKEAKLVEVEGGIKYSPKAILNNDLDRHIRFHYPTEMYDDKYFEIDDEGNPYWVIPTIKKEIGVISGKTNKGVIIVNPVNGDIKRYDIGSEPSWVDRATNDKILEKQATNALTYKNGFFNSKFAKKEVFQLSDGYNYYINKGNTYYVSCITSPSEGDQTSIGFVTINLKNGEATKYSIYGITEMRAREIAMYDERIKAQQLDSTWPILINFQGVPTYFIVLKNDVQDQKIVFLNVSDGSKVAMGSNIEEAKREYEKLLANSGIIDSDDEDLTVEANVTRVRDLGNTKEFMIEGITDKYFVVDINLNLDARFVSVGDNVSIKYKEYSNYNLVSDIKILP